MSLQQISSSHLANFFKFKPFLVIFYFALLSVSLSFVPSPWWEGHLLDIDVRWPKEFTALGLTSDLEKAPSVHNHVEESSQQHEQLPSTVALEKMNQDVEAQLVELKAQKRRELEQQKREREEREEAETKRMLAENQELIASLKVSKPEIPLEVPCLARDAEDVCQIYALDHFFRQLRNVALKKATKPVRLSQYGDSLISGDGLTGRIRQRLQAKFGYGGHGYIPPVAPARFMGFNGIRVSSDDDWSIDSISKSKRRRKLGFGGASFKPNGNVSLKIREDDDLHHISRVGVFVDPQTPPKGITIRTKKNDSEEIQVVPSTAFVNGVAWIDFSPTSEIELTDFQRATNYYGIFAETDTGVVVDNVGMLSARTTSLLAMESKYWSQQLDVRGVDLVSFSFGTNSATLHKPSKRWLEKYTKVYQSILTTAVSGNQNRNCLVLGILTRGYKDEEGMIRERDSVKPLAAAQKEAAHQAGCAFWNMNQAISGKEGPAQWYEERPQLIGSDFTHPTRAGYRKLGDLFYDALMFEFVKFLKREK